MSEERGVRSEERGRLLPVSVVAARLGCSVSNVYRLIGRGDLACLSLGASKGYRVPESAVEAMLKGGLPRPASPSAP